MSHTLLVEHAEDGVSLISFNRPQALNALDLATMADFANAIYDLQHLVQAGRVRCVIITGEGRDAFSSGGDLNELRHHKTLEDAVHLSRLMGDALFALERLPVPVIGALQGYALGGGSEIALACDMRFADETTRMGFVQINMALTPAWGAGQRLLRLVGYARAMELLLRGEPMQAQELAGYGLVNWVVPAGTARQAALELARQIAKRPPAVVQAIKSLLIAGQSFNYEAALVDERNLFPSLWASDAHNEAVERYFSNRKKNDSNRKQNDDKKD